TSAPSPRRRGPSSPARSWRTRSPAPGAVRRTAEPPRGTSPRPAAVLRPPAPSLPGTAMSRERRDVLRVARLRPGASIPRYATEGAAGMDLAACLDEPLVIPPGETARVPTGIAIALPPGHEGQVRPRSGLAFKHAVTILNAPGT